MLSHVVYVLFLLKTKKKINENLLFLSVKSTQSGVHAHTHFRCRELFRDKNGLSNNQTLWVLSNSSDSASEMSKHLADMITIDFQANRSLFSSVCPPPLSFPMQYAPTSAGLVETGLLMRQTAKQGNFKRANQQQGLSIQKESGKLYEFFMY